MNLFGRYAKTRRKFPFNFPSRVLPRGPCAKRIDRSSAHSNVRVFVRVCVYVDEALGARVNVGT